MNRSQIGLVLLVTLLMSISGKAFSTNLIFADGFEIPSLRGTNVVGMEMAYFNFDQTTGPVAGTDYPIYDNRLIDYFAAKHMSAIRLLFSWEGMQSTLNGPIPAASSGNYQAYFDHFKSVVDYASNEQHLIVIIEPWQANAVGGAGGARWRGDLVGSTQVPISAFADFWGKMATHFKDNPRVHFGLMNEPNNMATMTWFSAAQAAITAIRHSGASQRIYVPGNGYTAASAWTANYYDQAATPHSNAFGWLNANGAGQPLTDPLHNIAIEVHTYLDPDQCGCDSGDPISTVTAAREHLANTMNWANVHGYRVYLGEIGLYAGANTNDGHTAAQAWADFIAYVHANAQTIEGFTWWAGGMPQWWPDIHGPHFSISPTNPASFTGDSINMQMIENDF